MQVEIVTPPEAKFRKWSIWSDWVDVVVSKYGFSVYLIQMRMTRRNRKQFRTVKVSTEIHCGVESLTQMKAKEGRSNG